MNEDERRDFAERLRGERTRRFLGSRKAAYTAAGVNAATWSRAENAETIKEASLVAIVSALWPESGGDWKKIPSAGPGAAGPATYADLGAPGANPRVLRDRVDAIEEQLDDFETRLQEIRSSGELSPDIVFETAAGDRVYIEVKGDHDINSDRVQQLLQAVKEFMRRTDGPAMPSDAEDIGQLAEPTSIAARTGKSVGQQLRSTQDVAGEESQDPGDGEQP